MSCFVSRPTVQVPARWGVCLSSCLSFAILLAASGCGSAGKHYVQADKSLLVHNYQGADAAIKEAEDEYGDKSRVLYGMDRGMTLHLAGDYKQSNLLLEQSDEEVERLYTRKIRTETAAFMTNDNVLPYEGDPYEQVMINVVKALNYAMLGLWQESLVEARRIDHRLNVLSDRVKDKSAYREDGFARYLTGILYESTGDVNNAFIAYRKAYETYESMRGWSRVGEPAQLQSDLLRTADALHLTSEFAAYERAFPGVPWQSSQAQQNLAQVVVISYNGRAPRKEDQFLDLPISMDALQLVLINRALTNPNTPQNRAADTALYGLNGRVVRVALPRLVPQPTHVPVDLVTLDAASGAPVSVKTEPVQNVTALAEKALSERLPGVAVKAVARAATKYAMAEAATRGSQSAAGQKNADWVGLLVSLIAHGYAVASEEADKRSWRTLPDQIHLARRWVPPGHYDVKGTGFTGDGPPGNRSLSLTAGQTVFLIQRVVQ